MEIVLLYLARPLHKHGITLAHITYSPLVLISLITGWTVCTEKYKARGPDV